MNNILQKIICFICVLVTACSALFASACKDKTSEFIKTEYTGNHVYTADDTDEYVVKDGRTDYVLVLPETYGVDLKTAKDEFIHLFKLATGLAIVAVSDKDLNYDENSKYFSLGNTAVYEKSGLNLDLTNLRNYGARVVTKGKSVFMLSETEAGLVNSVYVFMEVTFNYDYYYRDVVEIDKVSELKLKNYDVTDVPDIQDNIVYTTMLDTKFSDYDMDMYRERMRATSSIAQPFMSVWRGTPGVGKQNAFHNSTDYLPKEENEQYVSYFYSDRGDQLCYTAHGNPEAYQVMVQKCTQKVIDSLKYYSPEKFPHKNTMTITMQDNDSICSCPACAANKEKYGAESASVILFVNEMCKGVEEWMQTEEGKPYARDDFNIMFFAYNSFEKCPATKVDGKYVLNQGLTLHPMLSVWLALSFSYVTDFYDPVNDERRECMQSWYDVCENVRIWTYSKNFIYDNAFYDVFNFYTSDFYQYIAANGTSYMLNEGNGGSMSTNFQTLAVYLHAKLRWNSSLDSAALTDKWFDAMYKEAAPKMKEVFNNIRLYMLTVERGEGEASCTILGNDYGKMEYWPEGILRSWMSDIDEAKKAVEKYKTSDYETYVKIVNHIDLEYIAPATHMLKFYSDKINYDEYTSIVNRLKEIHNYVQDSELEAFLANY